MEDWFSKCSNTLDIVNDEDNNNNNNINNINNINMNNNNINLNNINNNNINNDNKNNNKKFYRLSKQIYNLNDFDDDEDEFSLSTKQPNFIENNLNNSNNNNNNEEEENNNNNKNNLNNSSDNNEEEDDEEEEEEDDIVIEHIVLRRKYTVTPFETMGKERSNSIWKSPHRSIPRPDSIRVLSEDRRTRYNIDRFID